MKRREFIDLASTAMLAPSISFIPGCRAHPERLISLVGGGDINQPLVIDTHAHIFNGSDLQVDGFITKVAANETESSALRFLAQVFGPILQGIVWELAPNAQAEFDRLVPYLGSSSQESLKRARDEVEVARSGQFDVAKSELERVARQELSARSLALDELPDSLESLPLEDRAIVSLLRIDDSYEDLFGEAEDSSLLSSGSRKIRAAIKFLIEMFQYRHVSAVNYFETYTRGSLVVDLITPCIVDFEGWLGSPDETPSSISEQIVVNEIIAALSGGRIHPFVPFNPLQQLMWNGDAASEPSPVQLATDAVLNRGFMGIKLYPPMGFAVYGNEAFSSGSDSIWKGKTWLPAITQEAQFGDKLDRALCQLYEVCEEHDIPVLAHTSPSNMPDESYERLLSADSWLKLYESFDLRTSFGHFSGIGSGTSASHWRGFVDILKQQESLGSRPKFADASYFSRLLTGDGVLPRRLRGVLFNEDESPTPVFDSLMYGSDWKMLLMEPRSDKYLEEMWAVLGSFDTALATLGVETKLQARVMGLNAVKFLGLERGMKNRDRLERFYEKYKIAEPMWIRKVDG